MRKVTVIVMLFCSILTATPVAHGAGAAAPDGPEAVEEWFQTLKYKKESVTKLHFYFHDILSGKNPTAVNVAQANMTFQSPTLFGIIYMIDDPLTDGPEPNSTVVGRAQGFYGSAGQEELALIVAVNYVFTSGKFNGSTLSILGRNPPFHAYREMAVVGGSGVFRLARGVATAKTHWYNATTGDVIVEYNVVVVHY